MKPSGSTAFPTRRPSAVALAALVLLGAGCKGLPPGGAVDRSRTGPADRAQAVGPAGPAAAENPLDTIARYEAARSDGEGLLETLLAGGEEATRERAAVALGRLPWPEHRAEVTSALASALKDPTPRVRAAAAFGLGLRGDPAGAEALLGRWNDPDPAARARFVEAASRIGSDVLRREVLRALDDPSSEVRREAAVAPHRWASGTADAADARDVDRALATAAAREDAEVRWRALFSLARRKSETGRAAFVAALGSPDARARIFAAQGLGAIAADPESRGILRRALADQDWRVSCEAALALAKHPDPGDLDPLRGLLGHPSPHVRRCACESLGAQSADAERAASSLERARVDASPNVRAAAIASRARLLGDAAAPELDLALLDKDPLVRAGAAQGAALLSPGLAVPLLARISKDPDLRVAGIAASGFSRHASPESRVRLRELLAGPDNGLRLAAAEALETVGGPEDLPDLARCVSTSRGDIANEIAATCMKTAAKIGGAGASEILKQGLSHPDPFVRRRAREMLPKDTPEPAAAARSTAPRASTAPPARTAGNDRPKVAIDTRRGTMVFELLPDEAPAHVRNFLELARAGHYDRLVFHRVVPDFVIQGGDYRGDGNGGRTFDGAPLRSEFTPRKFERGSLGMPRNDDPDSGGSQFFVTHRETPHLDGRYTLFGGLVEGAEVLDAIEVGDAIVRVRVLDGAAVR